jgi:hypothetical protein
MTNFDSESVDSETSSASGDAEFSPQWGENAPRGGKTVLGRILKDGAKVPLFLGQTLVNSLRDLGYNTTTSAVCELVDNSIQWGADEIRVYFNQSGHRGEYVIDVLVMDNGQGMAPHVLKVATAFGGSMVYENRGGIGRYGMGMKAAALSMSPILDIYSWQEPRAVYNMTLDVEDIGNNRSNLIELPDPTLIEELPTDVVNILTRAMVFPKRADETQELFARGQADLLERLGDSGTIVFMPNCDRVTYRTAQTLVEHATKEMGRVYRRFLEKGLKLYVNNRRIEAFDPTYWMSSARHTRVEGLRTTQSRLIKSWQVPVPVAEESAATAPVSVRLYLLPFQEWGQLPRKVLKNDLHVFDDHTVSFMRNDREVAIGSDAKLKLRKHHGNNWLRLQIDFTGELDEAFGVSANKQGVRPKGYVYDRIVEMIGEEVQSLRQSIYQMKAEAAATKSGSRIGEAERRATDAEALQGQPLPDPAPETDDEKIALEANLRGLAMAVKREDETEEEASQRVMSSKYIVVFKHDEYWPFYHCEFRYGKAILTVNTAHAFFRKLWQPLSEIVKSIAVDGDGEGEEEIGGLDAGTAANCAELLVSLQLLLLSLARTQGQISLNDPDGEHRQLFDKLRREWSTNLQTQLEAK